MKDKWLIPAVASLALVMLNVGIARAADEKEADEQKVSIKQVPSAARKTLKREAGGQKIKTVDKEKLGGKTVYEADVNIDGHNYEIVVDKEGLLLSKKLDEEGEKPESDEAQARKNVRKADKDYDAKKSVGKQEKEEEEDKGK